MGVPIVDISPLFEGLSTDPSFQHAAHALVKALSTSGLLFIKGFGLTREDCIQLLDAGRLLFLLEQKEDVKIKSGGFSRGYMAKGGESGSNKLELKEGFVYGYNWDSDSLLALESQRQRTRLHGNNVWPPGLPPNQRKLLCDFYTKASDICMALTRGVCFVLGVHWDEFCARGREISLMRLFHYFPSPKESIQRLDTIGSSAHTDWGFLTLILQDLVGGLAYKEMGEWKSVPALEDYSLVVNCGDYLSLLSGGKLRSPLHQVTLSSAHRFSFVYFFYPDYDAKMPLATSGKKTEQSLFLNQAEAVDEPSLQNFDGPFGDYIFAKWKQVFRKGY